MAMNGFKYSLLCLHVIAGAAFAMMWSNIQSINVEMNKPKPKPRHPEILLLVMK